MRGPRTGSNAEHRVGVGFVVPELGRPSGGSVYNAEVARAWPTDAPPLHVHPIPAHRAATDRADHAAGDELGEELVDALREHPVAVIDGLLGSERPDAIAAAHADGHRVLLLVHMARPDDPALAPAERDRVAELEERSVREAWGVVSPSAHAAADLAARYGREGIVVARPGVRPAALAEPHATPCILQLGAIGPLKNQALVLEAARRVRDLPFRLRQIGPVADEAYAERLRAAAAGLAPHTPGPEAALEGDALERAFASADLVVSVASSETYGLVVTEALARGIPAIVGRGTGAEEALAAGSAGDVDRPDLPGVAVSADDADELATALRRWLTDATERAAWRERARAARERLPDWASTARVVADACADALSDRSGRPALRART